MDQLLILLETYGYLLLFPLSVIEGPIITIIGGFLVTLGIFDPFIVYGIVVAGDIVGDAGCYALGRWGGKPLILTLGPYIGVTEEKLEQARTYFSERHVRALAMSKLIHGVGFAGLIAAGSVHIPYLRFFRTCASITAVQSLFFLLVGILFGHAYTLLSAYLNYYAAGASLIALVMAVYILYRLFGGRTSTNDSL